MIRKIVIPTLLLSSLLFLVFGVAAAQDVPGVPEPEQGYRVGPADEITVKVLGEPQFDFVATVDQDGQVAVPFFDTPLKAMCRTEQELRGDIGQLLAKYLRKPQLSVRVTQRNSRPPATIYGEVRTPQQVELKRRTTLLELISFSGGVTEEAGGLIQIFRTRPPVCGDGVAEDEWKAGTDGLLDVPSRLYSLSELKLGREEANPYVLPGDVIIVQKASPVYITGEVIAPQGIYLKEGGLSLSEAIAKIGGIRREAKTRNIKIYRLMANSNEREIIVANYDAIRKGEEKDIMLQPYDIVEVDKAKKSVAQTILEVVSGAGRAAVGGFGNQLPTRVLY